MSEIESGTGVGLYEFLDWVADNGDVHPVTANAFKVASRKILSLGGDPDAVDVRTIDVEYLLDRFEARFKDDYKPSSMSSYKTRVRQAIALYLAWLDGNPDWVRIVRTRGASRLDELRSVKTESTGVPSVASVSTSVSPKLVKHSLPLRPDLMIQIELPVELTTADAERVAAFVRSLAFGGGPYADAESVGE